MMHPQPYIANLIQLDLQISFGVWLIVGLLVVSEAFTSNGLPRRQVYSGSAAECTTRKSSTGRCIRLGECYGIFRSLPEMGVSGSLDDDLKRFQNESFRFNLALIEDILTATQSTSCSSSPIAFGGTIETEPTICCPNDRVVVMGNNYKKEHTVSVLPVPKASSDFNQGACGVQNVKLRVERNVFQERQVLAKITGGEEAIRGEFPWMVAIFGINGKHICGGSLINREYVLTAAHCLASFNANDVAKLFVRIGDHNLNTASDGKHETRKVSKVFLHNGFSLQHFVDDIALMKLDQPVDYNDFIQPICLPAAPPKTNGTRDGALEGRKVTVAGWGRERSHGALSSVLRKVEVPIWNHSECQRVYRIFAPGMRITDNQLCAGDGKKNKDACIGDSGGPLAFRTRSTWYLLAIVSWGKGCGSFPGVYTRVDKYIPWIMKNIH